MDKEELINILRMFETGNEYSGTRMMLSSDNLHVGVFKWDYYPGGNYYWQEPEYMESLDDEYTLLEIANQIEQSMAKHSAYWHTVVLDIKQWCHYWECKNRALSEIKRLNELRSKLLNEDKLTDFAMWSIDTSIDNYKYELEILDK